MKYFWCLSGATSFDDRHSTRRGVLTLTGGALAALASTGLAAADHDHPDVSNVRHEPLSDSAHLLTGSLDAFGSGASSADVFFEWKGTEAVPKNTTPRQWMSEPGTFSARLTGLEPGSKYYYEAIAETTDGNLRKGGELNFWTTYE